VDEKHDLLFNVSEKRYLLFYGDMKDDLRFNVDSKHDLSVCGCLDYTMTVKRYTDIFMEGLTKVMRFSVGIVDVPAEVRNVYLPACEREVLPLALTCSLRIVTEVVSSVPKL